LIPTIHKRGGHRVSAVEQKFFPRRAAFFQTEREWNTDVPTWSATVHLLWIWIVPCGLENKLIF
jgi:hypothetical protein